MKLTEKALAQLALPDGVADRIWFDDDLPGFGLRIRSGGKRTWIVQYKQGGKQRRMTLGTVDLAGRGGKHGSLNLVAARKTAKDMLASIHLGHDPQGEKVETRSHAGRTLAAIVPDYLSHLGAKGRSPRYIAEVERHLLVGFRPLGEIQISRVTRETVSSRLREIATGLGHDSDGRNKGGLTASNRARAALSALYSWAIGEGLADNNPVVGTNKATEETRRDRVLTPEELVAVWRACGDVHGKPAGDYDRIVRLLILTGQRRDEIASMAASELVPAERNGTNGPTLLLPGSRTKNKLPHEVPLSPPAFDLVMEALEARGWVDDGNDGLVPREHVFGRGHGGFSGWSKAKTHLDQKLADMARAGKGPHVAPWRIHDLRRTMATSMGELGIQPHVVEAVLNHISGSKAGVAGIYNRATYRKEKTEALVLWADHVLRISAVPFGSFA